MRPCSINSTRMLGMLESTFVCRRFDQKPGAMVTAWTGTGLNFA